MPAKKNTAAASAAGAAAGRADAPAITVAIPRPASDAAANAFEDLIVSQVLARNGPGGKAVAADDGTPGRPYSMA